MHEDPAFYSAKMATAHCYATYVLSQAPAFEAAMVGARGGEGILGLEEAAF
jgi:hypothetical protein